jgi:S-adenosylmethionine:tRNA ribosyltransferase-isomerase
MKPQDLYFELPEELIAEKPPIHRTESRLLVVDRKKKNLIETKFDRIIEFLDENTLLVFNNTKVFKARMYGKTENGK